MKLMLLNSAAVTLYGAMGTAVHVMQGAWVQGSQVLMQALNPVPLRGLCCSLHGTVMEIAAQACFCYTKIHYIKFTT